MSGPIKLRLRRRQCRRARTASARAPPAFPAPDHARDRVDKSGASAVLKAGAGARFSRPAGPGFRALNRRSARAARAPFGVLASAVGGSAICANRSPRDARAAMRNTRRGVRQIREFEEPLCALGAFHAKKSKRIIACQLRTDKVFVYFT